ncbi:MAG: homoserine O-succinyltransferase [Gammaproteobacteria bacterium]|nr:homoserine O-succinyltransferase [Gammaproteobacteria bacterium]
MPLVAHNNLPAFGKLATEGVRVLASDAAAHQDIRELHIGLLNMMPDAALGATERQFFRLIGESNPIAQFYVHPFTLDALPRSEEARDYIDKYYDRFDDLREQGLDALIITGANVTQPELSAEDFWESLIEVADWANDNVTSTLCSCLATHAVLEFRYGQRREQQTRKKWGVYEHKVIEPHHPLVADINSRFSVPHSRWNSIYPGQFDAAGLRTLVVGDDGSVHLATSADGFRTVFFQGHPEYDTVSLLKEYKREISNYINGISADYPPLPDNYLGLYESAILREYASRVDDARENGSSIPEFPEALVLATLDNTWHDTACAVVGNWMGLIYQITHNDRKIPFMSGVNPDDPLNLSN